MALHIVVTTPQQSGRIDVNLANRIGEIVSDGRPTLICVNQMVRNLDWYPTAEQTQAQREVLCSGIVAHAKQQWGSCGPVTVLFTDFAPDAHCLSCGWRLDKALEEMYRRDIKSVEDVSCSSTAHELIVLHTLHMYHSLNTFWPASIC